MIALILPVGVIRGVLHILTLRSVLTEHFQHFGRRVGAVLGRGRVLLLAGGRPDGDGALKPVGAPEPEPDQRVQHGDDGHGQHEEKHCGHGERHGGQLDVRVHQLDGPDVALRHFLHAVPRRHGELQCLRHETRFCFGNRSLYRARARP